LLQSDQEDQVKYDQDEEERHQPQVGQSPHFELFQSKNDKNSEQLEEQRTESTGESNTEQPVVEIARERS
jgi:hypothetical protein